MRILLINKFARVTGGADLHCLQLANLLRDAGHEVRMLSTADAANQFRDGIFVPVSVTHSTRDHLRGLDRAAVAARAFWNPDAARATSVLVERFRPDVIHAHKLYPQLSVAPLVVGAKRRVPIVQTIHDHEFIAANPLDDRRRLVDRIEDRFSYRALNTTNQLARRIVHRRLVNEWVAISTYVAHLMQEKGVRAEVIPNFVPLVAAPHTPIEARRGCTFVGRLSPEKGVLDVLEYAQRRPDTPVSIAGDGDLRPVVEQAARDLENVRYMGFLSSGEVQKLQSTARLCLFPARWNEAGGIAALEAMAVGTPVVAFRAGGLTEYVGSGGFAVGDRESMFAAADRLLDDADLWQQLSARAVNHVERDHSPARYVDRLVTVYRRAVERGLGLV